MQTALNKVFSHMLYEYKKGVRRLALFTALETELPACIAKLNNCGVTYLTRPAGSGKVNLFFGECPCIRIIETFGAKMLNAYDEKEDFILGILLGYDITKQCERYLGAVNRPLCANCV